MRVRTDGKFFQVGDQRFPFRAYRWPRADEPSSSTDLDRDLPLMAGAGFTVVSVPTLDARVICAARAEALRVLLRYAIPTDAPWHAGSKFAQRRKLADLVSGLRGAITPWSSDPTLLGVLLEFEGRDEQSRPERDRRVVRELAAAVHDAGPGLLVSALARWPDAVTFPIGVDFLTVELRVGSAAELTPALLACHRQVGDRPLVVGGVTTAAGADLPDRDPHACVARSAVESGCAGMVMPAALPSSWPLDERERVARANTLTVRDLDVDWPSISVVVCAYNAESTLEECLAHCDELDYPDVEIVVVDDGSTDRTAEIAAAHPRVRLLPVPHAGLSAARNAGYRAATKELVAYLDSDAYPPPEWVWYLGLAAADAAVAGCGGPNVPPPQDPVGAHVVARSPGGPLPQVIREDRAGHLPGCNMAFRKKILERLGGFDEALWTASDDLEFGWRLLDDGEELAYHPSALVWHHRRPGLRPYLRQQRGYGRSQAIIEARYPDRFPAGHRFGRLLAVLAGRGGATAATLPVVYQSLYWKEPPLLGVAHSWGMPAAVLLTATAPLGIVKPALAAPAVAAAGYVAGLVLTDAIRAGRDTVLPERSVGCRLQIAIHRVLRPLAFRWGHLNEQRRQRRSRAADHPSPAKAPP